MPIPPFEELSAHLLRQMQDDLEAALGIPRNHRSASFDAERIIPRKLTPSAHRPPVLICGTCSQVIADIDRLRPDQYHVCLGARP